MNLKDIIASTCLCDVNEVYVNIDNDFESMEVYENLYDTVKSNKKVDKPVKSVVIEEEEELSEDDFLDFL